MKAQSNETSEVVELRFFVFRHFDFTCRHSDFKLPAFIVLIFAVNISKSHHLYFNHHTPVPKALRTHSRTHQPTSPTLSPTDPNPHPLSPEVDMYVLNYNVETNCIPSLIHSTSLFPNDMHAAPANRTECQGFPQVLPHIHMGRHA